MLIFFSLTLSRISNASIHPYHTSRSAICFKFYTSPLSPYTYPNNSYSVDEYLTFPASLCSSFRLFRPCFMIGLYTFRFSSFGTISSIGIVETTRSTIICNGSTKDDSGCSGTFNPSVEISEASKNQSSTAYRQCKNAALFLAKFVL